MSVKYGINLCFKKYQKFSNDIDSGSGPLGEKQTCPTVAPLGMGIKTSDKQSLEKYVRENVDSVVFCRYGFEYLKSFPRQDDLAIGSFKINLDNLIFNRQKLNVDQNSDMLQMAFFMKTKT